MPIERFTTAQAVENKSQDILNNVNQGKWVNSDLNTVEKWSRGWRRFNCFRCVITLGIWNGLRCVHTNRVADSILEEYTVYSRTNILTEKARNNAIELLRSLDCKTKNEKQLREEKPGQYSKKVAATINALQQLRVLVPVRQEERIPDQQPVEQPLEQPAQEDRKLTRAEELAQQAANLRPAQANKPTVIVDRSKFKDEAEADLKCQPEFDTAAFQQFGLAFGQHINTSTDKSAWTFFKKKFFEFFASFGTSNNPDKQAVQNFKSICLQAICSLTNLAKNQVDALWYTYRNKSFNDLIVDETVLLKGQEFLDKFYQDVAEKAKLSKKAVVAVLETYKDKKIQDIINANKKLEAPKQSKKGEIQATKKTEIINQYLATKKEQIQNEAKASVLQSIITEFKDKHNVTLNDEEAAQAFDNAADFKKEVTKKRFVYTGPKETPKEERLPKDFVEEEYKEVFSIEARTVSNWTSVATELATTRYLDTPSVQSQTVSGQEILVSPMSIAKDQSEAFATKEFEQLQKQYADNVIAHIAKTLDVNPRDVKSKLMNSDRTKLDPTKLAQTPVTIFCSAFAGKNASKLEGIKKMIVENYFSESKAEVEQKVIQKTFLTPDQVVLVKAEANASKPLANVLSPEYSPSNEDFMEKVDQKVIATIADNEIDAKTAKICWYAAKGWSVTNITKAIFGDQYDTNNQKVQEAEIKKLHPSV